MLRHIEENCVHGILPAGRTSFGADLTACVAPVARMQLFVKKTDGKTVVLEAEGDTKVHFFALTLILWIC